MSRRTHVTLLRLGEVLDDVSHARFELAGLRTDAKLGALRGDVDGQLDAIELRVRITHIKRFKAMPLRGHPPLPAGFVTPLPPPRPDQGAERRRCRAALDANRRRLAAPRLSGHPPLPAGVRRPPPPPR